MIRSLKLAFLALIALPFGAHAAIGLNSDRYTVVSGSPIATVTLERSVLPGASTSVRVITLDGTALDGRDYQAIDQVVTFAPGQSTRDIQIPLIFNNNTQNRLFSVEISVIQGEPTQRFTRADVQILSSQDAGRDPGIIRLPLIQDSVTVSTRYTVTYVREQGASGRTEIRVRSRPGAGFTPIDQVLVWEDGETGGRSIEVVSDLIFQDRPDTIEVLLDATRVTGSPLRDAETFRLLFLSPEEVNNGLPGNLPVVFTQPNIVLDSRATVVNVSLVRLQDPMAQFSYVARSVSGPALQTTTFEVRTALTDTSSPTSGQVVFDTANQVGNFIVRFLDTPQVRDRQVEILVLQNGVPVTRQVITVLGTANDPDFENPTDSDTGTFSFLSNDLFLNSGTTNLQTFVSRTGFGNLDEATLTYQVTPLTNPVGADFDPNASSGILSWTTNERGNKPISILLTSIAQQDDREFRVSIRDASGRLLGTQNVTVTGLGNRAGNIRFLANNTTVPAESDQLLAFVDRTGSNLGPTQVQYRVLGGTAFSGRDFGSDLASGLLEWVEGEFGAKPILLPLFPRLVFAPRNFSIEIVGPGVTAGSSTLNVSIDPTPFSQELTGLIKFDREMIRTSPDALQVRVNVLRDGGQTGSVRATVLVERPEGDFFTRSLTWGSGDNDPKSLIVPVDAIGRYSVSLLSVEGSLGDTEDLTIQSNASDSGGGAMGWILLPLFLGAGLRLRRKAIRRDSYDGF